jgi:hypothetical protein
MRKVSRKSSYSVRSESVDSAAQLPSVLVLFASPLVGDSCVKVSLRIISSFSDNATT